MPDPPLDIKFENEKVEYTQSPMELIDDQHTMQSFTFENFGEEILVDTHGGKVEMKGHVISSIPRKDSTSDLCLPTTTPHCQDTTALCTVAAATLNQHTPFYLCMCVCIFVILPLCLADELVSSKIEKNKLF